MNTRHRHASAGLSLIELMVALAIGSVLVLGLVQVFAASRVAYSTAEGASRVQENARFAIDFLQRDIRMVGHFGCVNDQAHWVKGAGDLVNHFGATKQTLDFNRSILGYEATSTAPGNSTTIGAGATGWSPALPGEIVALTPRAGSDIISLRFFDGEGIPVNSLTASGGKPVATFPAARAAALTSSGVTTPTLFGVADCTQVDIFQGTLSGNAVTATAPDFSDRYTPAPGGQTQLYRAESILYYVANGASGRPSLWRARADHTGAYPAALREELVEGIESLQLLYGRDATAIISPEHQPVGNITQQDTAATLTATAVQWRRVGLVQVGVLASSPQPASSSAPTDNLRVLGTVFQPPTTADGRYRASYETTVALRNRLFGN